ncbi:hypothetical protein VNO77_42566 [Canavalia gladiata]|uniref:Uncharacterized protein n=1 Tax=Canavalia gladiata TaxID=3824 RepID=A0AAN9JSH8_CANGL
MKLILEARASERLGFAAAGGGKGRVRARTDKRVIETVSEIFNEQERPRFGERSWVLRREKLDASDPRLSRFSQFGKRFKGEEGARRVVGGSLSHSSSSLHHLPSFSTFLLASLATFLYLPPYFDCLLCCLTHCFFSLPPCNHCLFSPPFCTLAPLVLPLKLRLKLLQTELLKLRRKRKNAVEEQTRVLGEENSQFHSSA